MKRFLKLALGSLSISYPFLIYWGLQRYEAHLLLYLLLFLLLLRYLTGNKKSDRLLVLGAAAVILTVSLVWDFSISVKLYPVVINFGLFIIFSTSLIYPPTVIEKLARLQNSDLSDAAVCYTRKVTWVWCIFFIANGLVAAATAIWASDEIWVLYNGFIAYILIAILFAGEWLIRRRVSGV